MKILIQLIEEIVNKKLKKAFLIGKVIEIDGENNTCVVQPDHAPKLFDVRLTSIEDNLETQILIMPKIGSYVTVGLINGEQESFITKYSEIERIELVASDKVIINSGKYTTLKGSETKGELGKLSARVDGIIDALSNATVTPQDGGASFKAGIVSALQALQSEDFSQIENDKLLHG